LGVTEIVECVDAADQLVEFEDRLSGWVGLRQGTQLADQCLFAVSSSQPLSQ
jgi:hypothetical protein